jgi:hypothetical protein
MARQDLVESGPVVDTGEGGKVAQKRTQAVERARSVMQPLGDDWLVVMEWPAGVENGGPARLTIEPIGDMPVGGLSSTVLRRLEFGSAIEKLREQIADDQARDSARTAESAAIAKWRAGRLRSALAGGGGEDYLALLSDEYVRAVNRGQAKVNDYLAEMIGKPVSTVRGHLWRARKQGLLMDTDPGRKGGQLGPEAKRIVERIDGETTESFFEALESARSAT